MSSVKNLFNIMSLNKNEDDYDYEDEDILEQEDEDYDVEEEEGEPTSIFKGRKKKFIRTRYNNSNMGKEGNDMEVICFKPANLDETYALCDSLKDNRAVVLNLENVEKMTAQRIIDFVFGCCYSLEANCQEITNTIFMITPSSIPITGNFGDVIAKEK